MDANVKPIVNMMARRASHEKCFNPDLMRFSLSSAYRSQEIKTQIQSSGNDS